ncbi:MAG: putative efflux pump membrane fusion protein [Microgenomates bacterium OLB23]|nr:MAG: putative efflux pump membrane fusion protein [Microgenomates bacterium OLB23]
MSRFLSFVKKHKFIVAGAVTLLIIGGLYYRNEKAKQAEQLRKSAQVERSTLKESIILSGEVKAKENTTLHFQTAGRLAGLKVREGDVVKKGQLVAFLDQRDLKKKAHQRTKMTIKLLVGTLIKQQMMLKTKQ